MPRTSNTENGNKNLITCFMCGETQNPSFHYLSFEAFNKVGRLPYCKKCLKEIILDKDGRINKTKLIELLKLINRPYIFEIYNKSVLDNNDTLGTYMKNIAMIQYKNFGFKDSLFELGQNNQDIEGDVPPDLIHKWGKISLSDINYLETEYTDWCKRYDVSSKAMEVNIKEICYQQLVIKTKRENGDPVDKELKSLGELMGNSALKPIQESAAMSAESNTLGSWINKIEKEEPFPEVDPELADVDGFKKYIRVWFLGHMCRIMGIDNQYSQEYEDELLKYTINFEEEPNTKDGDD